MSALREAANSSQIEGTRANFLDVLKRDSSAKAEVPDDVDDIVHYKAAMGEGISLLENLAFSSRLFRDVHRILMTDARTTTYPYPGEYKTQKNWIGGMLLKNARYIPPPPQEISRAMGDLENFMNISDDGLPPLIKAALFHAQFETIHPFVDGNGRTGGY